MGIHLGFAHYNTILGLVQFAPMSLPCVVRRLAPMGCTCLTHWVHHGFTALCKPNITTLNAVQHYGSVIMTGLTIR